MTEGQLLTLQDRKQLSVTGVTDVLGFDDTTVSMVTDAGDLLIKGSSLHISRLSLEIGRVDLEGTVDSVEFTKLHRKKESFLTRIFK